MSVDLAVRVNVKPFNFTINLKPFPAPLRAISDRSGVKSLDLYAAGDPFLYPQSKPRQFTIAEIQSPVTVSSPVATSIACIVFCHQSPVTCHCIPLWYADFRPPIFCHLSLYLRRLQPPLRVLSFCHQSPVTCHCIPLWYGDFWTVKHGGRAVPGKNDIDFWINIMWEAAFAFGEAVLKRDHDAAVIALRDCLIASDRVEALASNDLDAYFQNFGVGEHIVAFSNLMPEATAEGWALYEQDVRDGLTDLIRGTYDEGGGEGI
jgi:hypothetical protein